MDAEVPLPPQPTADNAPPPVISPWTHVSSLLIFALLLTPLLFLGIGCYQSCSSYSSNLALRTSQAPNSTVMLYLDIFDSGVYTPTGESQVTLPGQAAPAALNLDTLAADGFVAVRLPHAPPSYTVSSLIAGHSPGERGARFNYFAPPTSTVMTSVPVTLTRRAEYEQAINARFPITDGKSHWEVWWLPAGASFPLPDGPFRLENNYPPPVELQFVADFGGGFENDCNGCGYDYVAFDGVSFHGPYAGTLVVNGAASPVLSFGSECTYQTPSIPTSAAVLLAPGEPFTMTFCLENYDGIAHDVNLVSDSQQAWAYTIYTQTVGTPATPVQAGAAPFSLHVPAMQSFWPGMVAIHAVYTPTFAVDASINEALDLTATSLLSPTLSARGVGLGFSNGFDPQNNAGANLYLPLTVKE